MLFYQTTTFNVRQDYFFCLKIDFIAVFFLKIEFFKYLCRHQIET